jgi:hypothetical protein
MANMGRCWFFELLQISSDRILPARHPFWPEDEFFILAAFSSLFTQIFLLTPARFSVIFTSGRLNV